MWGGPSEERIQAPFTLMFYQTPEHGESSAGETHGGVSAGQ